MVSEKDNVAAHYNVLAREQHREYQRETLLSLESYPANYFRLQILINRIALSGAKRVFDIGVGEGTPLVTLAKMGLDVAGCDVAEAMVEAARKRFIQEGLSPERIQKADIEDSITFANQLDNGPFDVVVALGVLPHVRNDRLFLDNVRMLVREGGKVFIEFRNKLFSLFTFNRYTKEFILNDLLGGVDTKVKEVVSEELDRRLATDSPEPRLTIGEDQPGYDAILSKFHNPFELVEQFEDAGFANCRIHWYHYHPAPPMLEDKLGTLFREEGMRLEHEPSGWRGYFLCSAGVVEADVVGKSRSW